MERMLSLLPLFALAALFCAGTLGAAVPDPSKPPEPVESAAIARAGKLSEFRDSLGDVLASRWRPSQSGRPGSSTEERFAKWVDLYGFVDLLVSDEDEVSRRWIARHLEASGDNSSPEERKKVTILTPGSSLPGENDPARHRILDEIAGDPSLVERVLGELVAPPFSSQSGPLASRLDPEFVASMVSDPVFLARWSEGVGEEDFSPKVLLNLEAIWKATRANPTDWQEFLPLALAIAVVRDQPAPSFWPHHQVDPANVPTVAADPAGEFSRWVKAFRDGKLRTDPRRLEAGELKFVVDAPIEPSELDWIRNSPSLSRQDPAQAFASVNYDKARLARDALVWPWGPYTLAQIRERGGICVDQAYYAAMVGKALGIPTICFSGQGRDGGHAWIGYLRGPRNWDFGVARYADQNYATGRGLDPQAWTPITDHDIELLTRHLGNRDPQDAARRDLVMARDFRRKADVAGEGRALESAITVCPENPTHWDAREEWMARSGAPSAARVSHHESAIRQFSRFRDLKAQHQEAVIRLALASGDRDLARKITEQIIHENKTGRPDSRVDLSARAAGLLVLSMAEGNDPEGAVEECRRQLQLQGQAGGGDFFYKVIAPLSGELIRKGRHDLARQVVKQADEILKPAKDSLVKRDLQRLQEEATPATVK